ncbi:MAG: agmatinase [Pseudomonadales bacterium]
MIALTEPPGNDSRSFLNFPLQLDLAGLSADFAVLGVPFGLPYGNAEWPNDQSLAPDVLRGFPTDEDIAYTLNHYDFDLGGYLLADQSVSVVDLGNVTHQHDKPQLHYERAEQVARKVFGSGAVLITLGGDHGVPIPILRALDVLEQQITLIHIDAHLDWRDNINGVTEGYSSPIRRASEMPWVGDIIQIGMRGIGSARGGEVDDALSHGCKVISAYDVHEQGMAAVLELIPDGPYYLTIDADGIDPTIMPGVLAQTPGGLLWPQTRQLLHGLLKKGRVVGMDLVEIAPSFDVGNITMIHAERLICNFIGASIRNGHKRFKQRA